LSARDVWLTILGLTVVTVVTRAFFLLLGERLELPERLRRALGHAPAAALVAIIVPDVLGMGAGGGVDVSLANPKLLAAVAAAVLYLFVRNMIAMIALGMAVFTAVRLLAG
jgi:branched-subunit amino acid transport protein